MPRAYKPILPVKTHRRIPILQVLQILFLLTIVILVSWFLYSSYSSCGVIGAVMHPSCLADLAKTKLTAVLTDVKTIVHDAAASIEHQLAAAVVDDKSLFKESECELLELNITDCLDLFHAMGRHLDVQVAPLRTPAPPRPYSPHFTLSLGGAWLAGR